MKLYEVMSQEDYYDLYLTEDIKSNYKLLYIADQTKKHNIPNLGDWGMGIYDFAIK
jgi:hypothetical protein